ncbi:MAG: sigma-54 dependent transcriptional regulator [candidate division Zixibacteria bacterium]|nr:sigma-54 dependent transcriptional regulator [candidate division Zixibacteria bacterium]
MSTEAPYHILLVDDDPRVLEGLTVLLETDYTLLSATSGPQALEIIRSNDTIAAVVLDIKMPGMDGIQTGRAIREERPELSVIIHTGFPGEYDEDRIVTSERPFAYVEKGGPTSRLLCALRNAVDRYEARRNVEQLTAIAESAFELIGRSGVMREVYTSILKVAPTDLKVMILGESGTGKELVARAIHKFSARRDKPLAIFNCNHKSPDLVESELFGHSRGAFTGAVADRIGLFEYASGGTVFLDEIGDLDFTTQAKLLRVLERGEFQVVGGGTEGRHTDVRVICATHRDLEAMVADGKFREDLFFRLSGFVITLPPLRERKDDIPMLTQKFAEQFTNRLQIPAVYFDSTAMDVLLNYDWPGNVRWLRSTIESMITMSDSQFIVGDDVAKQLKLNPGDHTNGDGLGLRARVEEFERNCIIKVLHETDGNVDAAARLLSHDPSNLRKKIRKHGIAIK